MNEYLFHGLLYLLIFGIGCGFTSALWFCAADIQRKAMEKEHRAILQATIEEHAEITAKVREAAFQQGCAAGKIHATNLRKIACHSKH